MNVRKLHRFIAMLSAPFTFFLAFSGIVINHKGSGILKKIHEGHILGKFGWVFIDFAGAITIFALILGLILWCTSFRETEPRGSL